jgi:hypothetical protein
LAFFQPASKRIIVVREEQQVFESSLFTVKVPLACSPKDSFSVVRPSFDGH